jgi:hypothetical protein
MDLRPLANLDSNLQITSPVLQRAWAVGQVLQARVVDQTGPQSYTLRAGAHTFEARSPLPLQPGQTLQLQVTASGDPTVLRILPAVAPEQAAVAQALRTALPRQGDIAPALQRLLTRLADDKPNAPPAGGSVRQLLTELIRHLPDPDQLTRPQELKQAVRDAGTFLEAKLAQQPVEARALISDLKANLLRVAAALRAEVPATSATPTTGPVPATAPSALTELPQALDSALARVQLNQIQSLPQAHTPAPPIVLEIPLRHGGELASLHVQIERDRSAAPDARGEYPWTMWVTLAPPGLGPIRARVATLNQEVAATFWAEDAQTAALLRANFTTLESNLQREGLLCRSLGAHTGPGPAPAAGGAVAPPLLDERA